MISSGCPNTRFRIWEVFSPSSVNASLDRDKFASGSASKKGKLSIETLIKNKKKRRVQLLRLPSGMSEFAKMIDVPVTVIKSG